MSVSGTGFRPTGPVFVIVIAKINVSPTTAGRPVGLMSVLLISIPAADVTCGTIEVAGGTGMPFVVVGEATTALLPPPIVTAVKRAVITVVPPIASGPTFVHVSVPATRLVAFAGRA